MRLKILVVVIGVLMLFTLISSYVKITSSTQACIVTNTKTLEKIPWAVEE